MNPVSPFSFLSPVPVRSFMCILTPHPPPFLFISDAGHDDDLDACLAEIDAAVGSHEGVHKKGPSVDMSRYESVSSVSTRCFPAAMGPEQERGTCPNLRCTDCDHDVLTVHGHKWHKRSDYLFFRNNVPDLKKLRINLISDAESSAYACQCKWKSVDRRVSVTVFPELRWVCGGHS